jgi:putative restriction endonuclease
MAQRGAGHADPRDRNAPRDSPAQGQGKFRERVSMIERACRITQVNRPEHLIASHCKPWRDCESNDERLDGENGLLLTPTVET